MLQSRMRRIILRAGRRSSTNGTKYGREQYCKAPTSRNHPPWRVTSALEPYLIFRLDPSSSAISCSPLRETFDTKPHEIATSFLTSSEDLLNIKSDGSSTTKATYIFTELHDRTESMVWMLELEIRETRMRYDQKRSTGLQIPFGIKSSRKLP